MAGRAAGETWCHKRACLSEDVRIRLMSFVASEHRRSADWLEQKPASQAGNVQLRTRSAACMDKAASLKVCFVGCCALRKLQCPLVACLDVFCIPGVTK